VGGGRAGWGSHDVEEEELVFCDGDLPLRWLLLSFFSHLHGSGTAAQLMLKKRARGCCVLLVVITAVSKGGPKKPVKTPKHPLFTH